MKVFVVRSDFGRYTKAFKENNYVGIGWFDQLIDKTLSREQIKDEYRKVYHKDGNMRVNQNAGQVYRFINDIKIDDIVITPYSDNRLLVGKVTSEVYYEKDTTSRYYLRKKVEWFSNTLDRQILSIPLQNTLRSSLTVYTLSNGNEILKHYNLVSNTKQKEIQEFNIHETIKKKLLELDGFEFETLVSYLLQTIGFEKTDEKQGGVADGGIDFEGILNIYGMATINLQVQVKRYESNSIKWKDIAAFRGAMKKDYQGCFITLSKFDKKAIENAQDKDKVAINLIDGNKLIDIFIRQYDEIIAAMREDDNDELADKLKFKKALVPY
ncbi:restriction endonuclease [Flavobacterium sp. HXWNR29]|uniref:restriction endonuclease n=1 Tax=Flavobacterium odoriferum TaxID=2946604 RepID=UPI0021CB6160|nr:restriction endonuclease [Flavobacterium sp. HXWNR29]MCU4190202.1 restriction endonuclease [Flavobacterium sp. HXWNR29]